MTDQPPARRRTPAWAGTLIALGVVILTLVLIEVGSFAVVSTYRAIRADPASDPVAMAAAGAAAFPDGVFVTNQETRDAQIAITTGLEMFRFRSYRMYGLNAVQSRFINHDPDGFRTNGQAVDESRPGRFTIWMIGSSTLYGAGALADCDTIPARVERTLNDRYPEVAVHVVNLGVPGYVTLQSLLQIKERLVLGTPDLVVAFDGWNDYNKSFSSASSRDDLFEYAVTHQALSDGWEAIVDRGIVRWAGIAERTRAVMPNTFEFLRLGGRWFALRAAHADVEAWKAEYAEGVAAQTAAAERSLEIYHDFWMGNVEALIDLSRRRDFALLLAPQPELLVSTKPSAGNEAVQRRSYSEGHFALEGLDLITEVKPYYMNQANAVRRELFVGAYRQWTADAARLAAEENVAFLDLLTPVDESDQPLFFSTIHFTPVGSAFVAGLIAERIAAMDLPGLNGQRGQTAAP